MCKVSLYTGILVSPAAGKTGDWKNHLTAALSSQIDRWIAKNLEYSDLQFMTELEHQD